MRILIVGPSWVGDAVMAQSLYKVLVNNNPATQIDVLTPEWSSNILQRMEEVVGIVVSPFDHGEFKLKARVGFGRDLVAKNYDQAIILTNSFKSALIPFFAKIPLRTGWLGEMRYGLINDIRRINKESCPLMVEQFAALGEKTAKTLQRPIPYPNLVVNSDNLKQLSSSYKFDLSLPSIALCPCAEFEPKRWPAHYFSEVADEYLSKGWQVVLLGSSSPKDKIVAEEVTKGLSEDLGGLYFDLIGRTKLTDAVDILSSMDVALTNDSGLMHVAAAVDTALVALYGPSSPGFTPPLSSKAKVLERENLVEIKPDEVLDALDQTTRN